MTADDKIGTMLPCNVIVQDLGGGQIEVAAINPAISMEHVGNPTLRTIAETVTSKLRRVIAAICRRRWRPAINALLPNRPRQLSSSHLLRGERR